MWTFAGTYDNTYKIEDSSYFERELRQQKRYRQANIHLATSITVNQIVLVLKNGILYSCFLYVMIFFTRECLKTAVQCIGLTADWENHKDKHHFNDSPWTSFYATSFLLSFFNWSKNYVIYILHKVFFHKLYLYVDYKLLLVL